MKTFWWWIRIFIHFFLSDINLISGEHMSAERGVDQRTDCYSPRRRFDSAKDVPLDINGNRSASDAPAVYTTRSDSNEDIFINENQCMEGEESAIIQGKLVSSLQTESPSARSLSRPRSHNSPGLERSTNRDLQRLSEEDLVGETSTSHRVSPLPSSSPGGRSPNGEVAP